LDLLDFRHIASSLRERSSWRERCMHSPVLRSFSISAVTIAIPNTLAAAIVGLPAASSSGRANQSMTAPGGFAAMVSQQAQPIPATNLSPAPTPAAAVNAALGGPGNMKLLNVKDPEKKLSSALPGVVPPSAISAVAIQVPVPITATSAGVLPIVLPDEPALGVVSVQPPASPSAKVSTGDPNPGDESTTVSPPYATGIRQAFAVQTSGNFAESSTLPEMQISTGLGEESSIAAAAHLEHAVSPKAVPTTLTTEWTSDTGGAASSQISTVPSGSLQTAAMQNADGAVPSDGGETDWMDLVPAIAGDAPSAILLQQGVSGAASSILDDGNVGSTTTAPINFPHDPGPQTSAPAASTVISTAEVESSQAEAAEVANQVGANQVESTEGKFPTHPIAAGLPTAGIPDIPEEVASHRVRDVSGTVDHMALRGLAASGSNLRESAVAALVFPARSAQTTSPAPSPAQSPTSGFSPDPLNPAQSVRSISPEFSSFALPGNQGGPPDSTPPSAGVAPQNAPLSEEVQPAKVPADPSDSSAPKTQVNSIPQSDASSIASPATPAAPAAQAPDNATPILPAQATPLTPPSAANSNLIRAGNPPNSAASSTPAAESVPMAPPAGPVQVAQMAHQAAQAEMHIGLSTSAFGNVEVHTVVRANDVGVLIGSEKGDLHSLLANELPGIANSLQQQNLRLNQVSFQHGLAFSNQMSSGSGSQSRWFGSRSSPALPAPADTAIADSSEHSELSSTCFRPGMGHGLSILA
jgi:hypothetical protein